MQHMLFPLLLAAITLSAGIVDARLVEEQLRVPIKVLDAYGKPVTQDIVVTLFHDDRMPQPRPLVLLNHGRATDAAGRLALGRARYSDASRWLAGMGFMVAVPTRAGYGISGGEDVECTGTCKQKHYPPAYAAAADQTLQVEDALRTRTDIDFKRTVVMGQSFGGATAVALAARNRPDIKVAINFAGGGGEFHQFPPEGEDGHALFTHAPLLWRPKALAFLHANGFPELSAPAIQ